MSDPQEPRDLNDPREGRKPTASPRPGSGSGGGSGGGSDGGAGMPVAVGWTGASGIAYGVRLVQILLRTGHDVDLTYSANVGLTVPVEMGRPIEAVLEELRAVSAEGSGQAAGGKLKLFARDQYSAPMASRGVPVWSSHPVPWALSGGWWPAPAIPCCCAPPMSV